MTIGFTPEIVVRLLRQTPLPVSTEAVMQDAIEQRLKDFLMPFEREVRMGPNILGVKSDQSRGITDPTLGMEARQKDDSRMRKLAMEVLGMTKEADEPEEDE